MVHLHWRRPVVLSDRSIKSEVAAQRILIEPFDESLVQPSSVDVRVDRKFRVFHNARYPYIDVRKPMDDLTELVEITDHEPFVLHQGEFVLGQTLETITLPNDIVARLEGKSSLGRLGLLIHSQLGHRSMTSQLARATSRQWTGYTSEESQSEQTWRSCSGAGSTCGCSWK